MMKEMEPNMDRDLETVGWSPPKSIVNQVSSLPILQRIQRIGQQNQALLIFLCQSEKGATEGELEAFEIMGNAPEASSVMSLGEKYYRLTFAIAVGLVRTYFNDEGRRIFMVHGDVYDWYKSIDISSTG